MHPFSLTIFEAHELLSTMYFETEAVHANTIQGLNDSTDNPKPKKKGTCCFWKKQWQQMCNSSWATTTEALTQGARTDKY